MPTTNTNQSDDGIVGTLKAAGKGHGPSIGYLKLCKQAADHISTLEARLAAVEGALEQGAAWFQEYADQHKAKAKAAPGTMAIAYRAKARRNRERAAFLRQALGASL